MRVGPADAGPADAGGEAAPRGRAPAARRAATAGEEGGAPRAPGPGAYAGTTALIDARRISITRSSCCSVMTRGGARKTCSATVPSGTG